MVDKHSGYGQSMPPADLSDPEVAIIAVLREGRATTGYMVDELDYTRSHINTHLRLLLAKDMIRKVHPSTALYELVDDPMESGLDDSTEPATADTDTA